MVSEPVVLLKRSHVVPLGGPNRIGVVVRRVWRVRVRPLPRESPDLCPSSGGRGLLRKSGSSVSSKFFFPLFVSFLLLLSFVLKKKSIFYFTQRMVERTPTATRFETTYARRPNVFTGLSTFSNASNLTSVSTRPRKP